MFPVASEGQPHYTDDFGVTGQTGKPHQGIDIFAASGTPILAVDDGALRFDEDPLGGHAFYLKAGDGTTYYGAHLSAYEGQAPRTVTAGDVIGYVGKTGNAASTTPHLHFEEHPGSAKAAVDPYKELQAAPLYVGPSEPASPPWAPAPATAPPASLDGSSITGLVVGAAIVTTVGLVVSSLWSYVTAPLAHGSRS